MVSLAIFALMAVVLGAAYINVLNSYAAASRSRDADEDAAFACQQLLVEPDVDKAREGDQFDSTDGRHVVWSATIDPTTTADLFTVTFNCEVSGSGQQDSRKVARTFNLLRPTWSDPAERNKLLADTKDRIAEIQSKTANGFAPADTSNAAGGGVAVGNRGGNNGKGGAQGGAGGNRGKGGGNGRATQGPARNDGTVPTPPPNTGKGTNGGNGTNNPRRTGAPRTPGR